MLSIITEARNVGGRGAVWALCKSDPRLFDAAAVIERCRTEEHTARIKAGRRG